MASARLLLELAERGFRRPVTVISDEETLGYNRVLLPDFLGGQCTLDALNDPRLAKLDLDLTCVYGTRAAAIDCDHRTVETSDGDRHSYRQCVLAMGSRVPLPDLPGMDKAGVGVLRSLADALRLDDELEPDQAAVVVGGGLLGLEAARALLARGLRVTVVHRNPRLLNRQVDRRASEALAAQLEALGLSLRLGDTVQALRGDSRVREVLLTSGATLPAHRVLFATGSVPNTEFIQASGYPAATGIQTDPYLRATEFGDGHCFAVGECALVNGDHFALVEPVYAQAAALASVLTGNRQPFQASTPSTRLKVAGIELFSAGNPAALEADPRVADVIVEDRSAHVYRRLFFTEQRLSGAVLLGNTQGARNIQTHLGQLCDATGQRDALAFGL